MTKKYIDAERLIELIIDDTPICSADGANAEDHDIFIVGEAFAHVIGLIAAAPAADVQEARSGRLEWNNHAVACLLAELFDDTCACNYNDIDEWLPEKCEVIDACPNPVGVACWEQFLKHRSGR